VQPMQLQGFDGYHALAFVAPALSSVPMVVTLYDLSFIHYPERLPKARRLYLQRFTTQTCQRVRRVIAISEATAHDAAQTLNIPLSRIDIAPPGCDAARFRPLPIEQIAAFRREKDLPERFWLFVGTLEPRKNIDGLLDAYLLLRARLPDARTHLRRAW